MLSRMAESLYWIGRHVERADGTARILDAHVHGSFYGLGQRGVDRASRRLLKVMGVDVPARQLQAADVLELLAYDETQPSSIMASARNARDNARGVREAISGEVWEVINATHLRLPSQRAQARVSGPDSFLAFIRTRSALVGGHIEATMSRDDGWRFLVLGRSLERADMTARLLAAQQSQRTDLALLLRSCGGHEAYLRAYRGHLDSAEVAEFLMSDRLFPRSLLHTVDRAGEVLSELEPAESRIGMGGEASRVLGAARARIAYSVLSPGAGSVLKVLEELQQSLGDTHEAIANRFFRQIAPVRWSAEAQA